MTEQLMETTLRTALWQQFGATIDMLENALLACPSMHWHGLLWSDPGAPEYPTFWSITHHTLFWLDLHLTGSLEGFAPPAPFTLDELDPAGSDEKAHQQVAFPWARGKPVSYLELLLYSMRHVQEHAAQLSLFLGQHAIPDEALDWVARAKGEASL